MSRLRNLALGAFAVMIAAAVGIAAAQTSVPPSHSQTQEGADAAPPGINSQGGGPDTTLEIAPQPGVTAPKPGIDEIPGGDNFRPGENTDSVNPNYRPRTENGDSNSSNGNNRGSLARHGRPYLGITIQETDKCFKGKEEHGLEVLTVDPNSPAAAAGVKGSSGANAVGATASTIGALIPFAGTLITSQLEKRGDMGMSGDLIVAIDDQRVRTQQDLDDAIANLKPGDTMYLTVIRPGPDRSHTTQKLAVHVGQVGQPVANAGPPLTE
ncbi:MAG TPA: PDZ domain-containing protein [Candidatus Binataceae bacterium]|nr:PDZ domain-containing protein [Candidatus Binataceae bacterium]